MNIAVYCSARNGIAPECFDDARRLGRWIGESGHTLVYGGLKRGLMDAVAQATADAGGKVIGVVPQARISGQHEANTVSILVPTLHERKQTMEERSEAFVALDGGYGTVDHLSLMSSRHLVSPEVIERLTLCPTIDSLITKLSEL